MINFFKEKGRGGRVSASDPYSNVATLKVDATPTGREKAGFSPNKKAIELLGLECTGEEYLVFAVDGQRVFATVSDKDTVQAMNCVAARVGKTGKMNNKTAWELVSGIPTVGPGGYVKLVAADVNADVTDVYEIVAMTPEVDNSPEAEFEAEMANVADVVVQEETTDNFGF